MNEEVLFQSFASIPSDLRIRTIRTIIIIIINIIIIIIIISSSSFLEIDLDKKN